MRGVDAPWPRQSKVGDGKAAAAQLVDHLAVFLDEFGLAVQQHADAARRRVLRRARTWRCAAGAARRDDEMRPQRRRAPVIMALAARLLQDRPELHGKAHVAGDRSLPCMKARRAVEFALDHLVEGVERHRNRAVGGLAGAVTDRIGLGLAVDQHAAGIAEVEFERAAEARIGADRARPSA